MGSDERWGQLTYASFDIGDGSGGGWRIKEMRGDLTPAEIEGLRSRIVTAFQPVGPLPSFPTPTEIENQPRRFVYGPVDGTAGWAYWHAVQSGFDGTGRPGNVFSHVLLDRLPTATAPSLRPIETWRSGWLTPFGPQQVVDASLPADPPPTPSVISRAGVLAFLLDPSIWRTGLFGVLLDAVAAARGSQSPVVFVTDSVENAALWMAAVSYFMSAGTSRRMGFSLFERADGVASAGRRGLDLVCIPRADVSALQAGAGGNGLVLLDEGEAPQIGDLGGDPHRTMFGSSIPVTAWSVMAQVALVDLSTASAALQKLDDVADRVGDRGLHAAWPLALAVALRTDVLGDATHEAAGILRDHSPEALARHPDLWEAASILTHDMFGGSTGEIWTQIEAVGSAGGSAMTFATTVYLERALRDVEWLRRGAGAPVPADPGAPAAPRLITTATSAIDEWRRRFTHADPAEQDVIDLIHLVDFVARAGLLPYLSDELHVDVLFERFVVPVLISSRGRVLVDFIGLISGALAECVIRPVLVSLPVVIRARPGALLSPTLVDWLFPTGLPQGVESATMTALEREYVIRRCRQGESASVARHRAAAVLGVLRMQVEPSAMSTAITILSTRDPGWSIQEVAEVERVHPRTLPAPLIFDTVSTAATVDEALPVMNLYHDTLSGTPGYETISTLAGAYRAGRDMVLGDYDGLDLATADVLVQTLRTSLIVSHSDTMFRAILTPAVLSSLLMVVAGGPRYEFGPHLASILSTQSRQVDGGIVRRVFSDLLARGGIPVRSLPNIVALAAQVSVDFPFPPASEERAVLGRNVLRSASGSKTAAEIVLDAFLAQTSLSDDELASEAARTLLAGSRATRVRHADLERAIATYLKQRVSERAARSKGLFGRRGGPSPKNEED